MAILLDTHAFLWFAAGDRQLPSAVAERIEVEQDVFISAASVYEIVLKHRFGKLPLADALVRDVAAAIVEAGCRELALTVRHMRDAAAFAAAHRDPFDRMIAAQAMAGGLVVITRDSEITGLGAQTYWG